MYFFFLESIILLNRLSHSANSVSPMCSLSYDVWNRVNRFAESIFTFSYFSFSYVFFFLESIILLNRFYHSANSVSHVCTFIRYMKMNQSFCWIDFYIQQIHLLLCMHFHTIYEIESIILLDRFLHSAISLSPMYFFFSSQSFCWIVFIIQQIQFLMYALSYDIWKWINRFAESIFTFSKFICSYVFFFLKSIILLNRFLHSANSFSSMHSLPYYIWKRINRFAESFSLFSYFIFSCIHFHV